MTILQTCAYINVSEDMMHTRYCTSYPGVPVLLGLETSPRESHRFWSQMDQECYQRHSGMSTPVDPNQLLPLVGLEFRPPSCPDTHSACNKLQQCFVHVCLLTSPQYTFRFTLNILRCSHLNKPTSLTVCEVGDKVSRLRLIVLWTFVLTMPKEHWNLCTKDRLEFQKITTK